MLSPTYPREVLFTCPPSPAWNPSYFTVDSTFSSSRSRFDFPLSRQGAAFAHHDSLSSHYLVIWTDYSVCGIKATLSFSAAPVCSSFSAEVFFCKLSTLGNINKYAVSLLFSSSHSVFSSVFFFTSNSLANLAATVYYLLLYYQATMGFRTLISSGEQRG